MSSPKHSPPSPPPSPSNERRASVPAYHTADHSKGVLESSSHFSMASNPDLASLANERRASVPAYPTQSSLASGSASPGRVRFNPEPASPSSGRSRRGSLPYPTVAQSKGASDRKFSYDLFWKLHSLSAVSDVIPVDRTEGPDSAPASTSAAPEPTAEPRKRRGNWIVLGRKQTEALMKSEKPRRATPFFQGAEYMRT